MFDRRSATLAVYIGGELSFASFCLTEGFPPFSLPLFYRRGLNPPHRVKSITMTTFTPEEIEQIKNKGNEVSESDCSCPWNAHSEVWQLCASSATFSGCPSQSTSHWSGHILLRQQDNSSLLSRVLLSGNLLFAHFIANMKAVQTSEWMPHCSKCWQFY